MAVLCIGFIVSNLLTKQIKCPLTEPYTSLNTSSINFSSIHIFSVSFISIKAVIVEILTIHQVCFQTHKLN